MERAQVVHTLADVIGVVTVGIGAGLSVDPVRSGAFLGLREMPERARVIGLADLAVGVSILTSGRIWPRYRWPALVARELLHLAIANEYRRRGNSAGVLAMGGLLLADGTVTVLMCVQERRA